MGYPTTCGIGLVFFLLVLGEVAAAFVFGVEGTVVLGEDGTVDVEVVAGFDNKVEGEEKEEYACGKEIDSGATEGKEHHSPEDRCHKEIKEDVAVECPLKGVFELGNPEEAKYKCGNEHDGEKSHARGKELEVFGWRVLKEVVHVKPLQDVGHTKGYPPLFLSNGTVGSILDFCQDAKPVAFDDKEDKPAEEGDESKDHKEDFAEEKP